MLIATSVVRSSHQGESHGGVYIVDLQHGTSDQVVDWNTTEIDWSGHGLDRGLRGVTLAAGKTYIAASDAVYVYDRQFRIEAVLRNRYLRHCHEIDCDGSTLWIASTGFDSVLAYDLRNQRFTVGYCIRAKGWRGLRRGVAPSIPPPLRRFDPMADGGPEPRDTIHLNTVVARHGAVYCSGTKLSCQVLVTGGRLRRFARIPLGTHNVQPYSEGVLMQNTPQDCVLYTTRRGVIRERWELPRYDESLLLCTDLAGDHARQAFGRGLCVTEDGLVVAGSSPSTVSVFRAGTQAALKTVTLTLDVRNAIHGLELYR
jgi:hypothetical protein